MGFVPDAPVQPQVPVQSKSRFIPDAPVDNPIKQAWNSMNTPQEIKSPLLKGMIKSPIGLTEGAKEIIKPLNPGAFRGFLGFRGLEEGIAPAGAPETMSRRIPKEQRANINFQIKKAKALYDAEKSAEPFYPGKPNADVREWYDVRLPALMQEIRPGTPSGMEIAEEFLTNRLTRAQQGAQNPAAIETPAQVIERNLPIEGMIKADDPFFSFTEPSKVGALSGEMFKQALGMGGDFYTDPAAQVAWGTGMRALGAGGKALMGSQLGQRLRPVLDFFTKQRGPFAPRTAPTELLPDVARLGAPQQAPIYNTIDITPSPAQPQQIGFNPNRPIEGTTGEGFVLGKGAFKKPTKTMGKPFRSTGDYPVPSVRGEPIEIPTRKFPNVVPKPRGVALPAPQGVDVMKPGSVRYGEGFKVSEPLITFKPPASIAPSTPKIFKKGGEGVKAEGELISPVTGKPIVQKGGTTPPIFKKKGAEVAKQPEIAPPIVPPRGSQGRVFRKEPIPQYVKPIKETVEFNGENIEIIPAGKVWKFKFRDRLFAERDKIRGLQKAKDIITAEGSVKAPTPVAEPAKPAAQPGIKPDTPFAGLGKPKTKAPVTEPVAPAAPTRSVDEQFSDISELLGKKVAPKSKNPIKNANAKKGGLSNKGQVDFSPAQRQAAERLQNDARASGKTLCAFLTENLGLDAEDVAQIVKMATPVKTRTYTIKYTDKAGKLTQKTMTGAESAVVKAKAEAMAKNAGGELTFFKQGRVKQEPIAGLAKRDAVKWGDVNDGIDGPAVFLSKSNADAAAKVHGGSVVKMNTGTNERMYVVAEKGKEGSFLLNAPDDVLFGTAKKTSVKTPSNVPNPSVELTVEEKAILNNYRKTVGKVSEYLNTGERSADLLKIAEGKLRQGGKLNIPDNRVKLVKTLLDRQDAMANKLVAKYGEKFNPRLNDLEKAEWIKLDDVLKRANISLEQRIRNRYISDKPVAQATPKIADDTEFGGLGVVKTEGGTYVPKKNIIERAAYNKRVGAKTHGIAGLGGAKPVEPASMSVAKPTKTTVYARPSKLLGKKAKLVSNGGEGYILDVDRGRYKILVGKRAKWYTKDKFSVEQGQTPISAEDRVRLTDKFAPTKGVAEMTNKGKGSIAEPIESLASQTEKINILRSRYAAESNPMKKGFLKNQIKQAEAKQSADAERILRRGSTTIEKEGSNILRNNRGELNLNKGGKRKTKSGKVVVVPIAKRSMKQQMVSLRGGVPYIKGELAAGNSDALKKALLSQGFKPEAIRAIINEVRVGQVRELNTLRAKAPEVLQALKEGTKSSELTDALKQVGYDKGVVDTFMKNISKGAKDLGVNIETATPKQLEALKVKAVKGAPQVQQQVNTANAALEWAMKNADSPLVQDTVNKMYKKLLDVYTSGNVPISNVVDVAKQYPNPTEFTKNFIKALETDATLAGQNLNVLSQLSKNLEKIKLGTPSESVLLDVPKEAPLWWDSINNAIRNISRERRFMLTGQLSTAMRNAESQEFKSVTELVTDVVSGVYKSVGSNLTGVKIEGGAFLPFQKGAQAKLARAEYNIASILSKISGGKVKFKGTGNAQFIKDLNAVLEGFELESARLKGTPLGFGVGGGMGPMNKLNLYGKLKKVISWANITQEMNFRTQAATAKLLEYSERYGTHMNDMAFWKANPHLIEKAVTHALRQTFAEDIQHPLAQGIYEAWRKLPILSEVVNPFVRFYTNSLKMLWNYNPTALAEVMLKPKMRASLKDPNVGSDAFKKLAMGTVGTAFAALGLTIRNSKFAGSKWYTIKPQPDTNPEKEIDLRPFAPFVFYLFEAEFMKDIGKLIQGKEPRLTGVDYAQALLSMNRIAGTGLVLVDILRADKPATVRELITRFIGQYLGGFTAPGRTLVDLYTTFDPESGKLRTTSEPMSVSPKFDKWVQKPENRGAFDLATILSPAINNLPVFNQKLPAFSRATQEGEAKTERPVLKQLTGITTKKVTPLQAELNRLNLTPRPTYGHPTINRRVNEEAVDRIEGNRIMDSYAYKKADDKGKKIMLQAMFSEAYSDALKKVKRTDKHLFEKTPLREKIRERMLKKRGKLAPIIYKKRD